jgi:hypothetical protein
MLLYYTLWHAALQVAEQHMLQIADCGELWNGVPHGHLAVKHQ